MTPADSARPRIEGDREQEILDATLEVLADVGYDRLTMDAVATRAHASKATLYRRWNGKVSLIVEALLSQKGPQVVPDTGTLRGDLLEVFCGVGGLDDQRQMAVLGAVITAIGRDADFAEAYRRDFLAPKVEVAEGIFRRALERGEIDRDVDLDLLTHALPGIVLHRRFVLGQAPSADIVTRVIDQIILPAATRGTLPPHSTQKAES